MSAKPAKTRKVFSAKSKSFLTHRPYLTIVVLAVLVCALAYTIELIQNSLISEARITLNNRIIQQQVQDAIRSAPKK